MKSLRARLIVCGKVFSGLGEGAKYVEIYSKSLAKLLQCRPFPGTLNISISIREYIEILNEAFRNFSIKIPPPAPGLGWVYAIPCRLARLPCLAVLPEKSAYGVTALEIVACVKLRDALAIEDGECVCVELAMMSPGGTDT